MELFPAIDLREGRVVRLTQGDFSREKTYGDPLELAARYVEAGARWIHVVDLDAARTGLPRNRRLVARIARATGARVQAGGGVRSLSDVEELLRAGVERVVVGTAAFESSEVLLDMVDRYPYRVAVGLDYQGDRTLKTSGWEKAAHTRLDDALRSLEALQVAALVVTAIERDGTLVGPDLEGLKGCLTATSTPIIASGGVASIADLSALHDLEAGGRRLEGVVVGKALLDERIGLGDALAACRGGGG
jgi:phosphoribosylformimino-5-aminoimidazole carboxamide ribotide isomerase